MRGARIFAATVVVAAGLVGHVPSSAQTPGSEVPQACVPTQAITLYAELIGTRKIGYGLTPGSASIPGPTISMTEGQCVEVTLVNHSDKRLSLHPHGVNYTVASDGTPLNDGCVRPGQSRTSVWGSHQTATRPDGTVRSGSAGYWHYHDHCRGGAHGTAGVERGLYGALIVRKEGDPVPDRDPFVVVMGPGTKINHKRAPSTPTFEANEGERVEFVVIGHGNEFHTFHLHGHRWADTRTGSADGEADPSQVIDNKTLGPADSFGFQLVAGEGVGPGAWMYHCHVQFHSDHGMSGMFKVNTAGGATTDATRAALELYRSQHAGLH